MKFVEWAVVGVFQMHRAVNTTPCGSAGCLTGLFCMYIVYCVFVWSRWRQRSSQYDDWHCPPAHPHLISLKSPFLIYPVHMQLLSPLTDCFSFSLSCFSQSAVLFLSVCGAAFPISSRPVCAIEPVKKRGVLLHGPPGVASDWEAVPVVLCIQWKEQGQWGVDCISWASCFIKTLLFLPPPSLSVSWSLECT